MTENSKSKVGVVRNFSKSLSKFRVEGERCSLGVSLRFAGIVGVNEYCHETLELCSHGGRVIIKGKRLALNVYENYQVEVVGRIEALEFRYGKN